MYPSKILLFGEYVILLNSNALSIPFTRFEGELAFWDADKSKKLKEQIRSNQILKDLLTYSKSGNIKKKLKYSFDFSTFEKDLEEGLYFRSDIPEESGLGSSGALVAAVFDKYTDIRASEIDLMKIKECLGIFESFYHGTSSGIDPLVSYLQKPLIIKNDLLSTISVLIIEESIHKSGMFLIYCEQKGKTRDLVNIFKDKYNSDPEYLSKIINRYIPVNDECIMLLTNKYNKDRFFSAIRKITLLQSEILIEMIPGRLVPLINYGLENNLFYLKLCGSGGGGYFLGFTENIVKTESYFNDVGYRILIY